MAASRVTRPGQTAGAGSKTHALLNTISRFFQGTFLESFDALVIEDGGAVKMTLEQAGGGDLTMRFSDGYTTLDCTPIIDITLTEGVDAQNPQVNYVYILQSAKVLAVSTTGWPAAEHIKVDIALIQTDIEVAARGALINQNINDHASSTSGAGIGQGHFSHIAERTRRLGAIWVSGTEGVATQDGNDLWVSMSAGFVSQMHLHTVDALDSDTAGAGDPILVVNDPDAAYTVINSLNEITKHSDGDAIGNNKYVKFVVWAVANKSGAFSPLMLNLPSEQYNTAAEAIADVEGHANFTIPAEFKTESTTGFLVAAFVCQHTSTAMLIDTTIDQRGNTPSTATGAGTGGGDVTAAAVIVDHAIVRGDGGAKGVQGSSASIADNGVMSVPGIGDGGLTNYDLKLGDVTTPNYGMLQLGNSLIGRTSYSVGAINLDGTVLFRNIGGPVTGEIEFIFTESVGNTCRFALPKSAVGNATYNPRSMLIAGPAPADTDFVKVTYWQTANSIFHNLACDTAGSGADLGVQGALEVEGDIFTDSIKESTPGANITLGNDVDVIGDVDVTGTVWTPQVRNNGNLSLECFSSIADTEVVIRNADGSHVANLDVEGDIFVGGTVDGRDVATDGTKLDGIDSVARAAHALLDGDVHTDSVADGVTRGSLVYGNATPKWDELTVGSNGQYLGTDGTDAAWQGLDLIDDTTPELGGNVDFKGNTAYDSTRAYVAINDQLYSSGTLGILTTPIPTAAIFIDETGTAVSFGLNCNLTYSGVGTLVIGIFLNTSHGQSAPTGGQTAYGLWAPIVNQGVADAGRDMKTYGVYTSARATGAQDSATGDSFAYSVYCLAAQAGSSASNTAGNFYAYSLFVEDASVPGGTTTTNQEWCALFEGDVQINSDKKLILQGTSTGKGDTYVVWNSSASTMDFRVNGDDRLTVSASRTKVFDELYVTGNVGFFTAPTSLAGLYSIISDSAMFWGSFLSFTQTGTAATITGSLISATHDRSDPTGHQTAFGISVLGVNKGVADAAQNMSTYGISSQASASGVQDSATGDSFAYSVACAAAQAGTGANTAGNFYAYSLFVQDATAPGGTPTTNQEWCALFMGDVQINSDKKLILEGSAISKGDTYIVWNTSNSHIEFWINGTLEGYVDTSGFVSV